MLFYFVFLIFNCKMKSVYILHDRPDLLHWHFPTVVAVVDVENLNRGTASDNRSTASVIDDGQLSEIRAAENMLLKFAIPDFTHIAPSPTDRTIKLGRHLPEQLVTPTGVIFNMAWDNRIHVSQKCTLQLIGRLDSAWGYECNGTYMSGITWTVDQIYVEFDPTKILPHE
jgi:hypothetical protein